MKAFLRTQTGISLQEVGIPEPTPGEILVKVRASARNRALDTTDTSWVTQLRDATAQRGVDVLMDFLAGPLINDSMRATALGARIVNAGRTGRETGTFDFDLHSLRRIPYCGMTSRTRTHQDAGTDAPPCACRKEHPDAMTRPGPHASTRTQIFTLPLIGVTSWLCRKPSPIRTVCCP